MDGMAASGNRGNVTLFSAKKFVNTFVDKTVVRCGDSQFQRCFDGHGMGVLRELRNQAVDAAHG